MDHLNWDYDFRETTLKGYFDIPDDPDFTEIPMHRIGTWYAAKMHDHYCICRLADGRPYGEHYFGL